MRPQVLDGLPPELRSREAIEAHIDRLISLLDMIDGDPDMEPSLGSIETLAISGAYGVLPDSASQLGWARSGTSDREQDAGDEPESDEDEEHWRQIPTLNRLPSAVATGWLLCVNDHIEKRIP